MRDNGYSIFGLQIGKVLKNRLGFLFLACTIFLTCVLLRGTTKDDCLVKNAIPPRLVSETKTTFASVSISDSINK